MGFAYGDDSDKNEKEASLVNEGGEDLSADLCFEMDVEFWPIEHPTEPPDEDRPVKCPMPDSSVMNNGTMHEKGFSESLWKGGELSALVNKEGTMLVAAEPPIRVVRRRHHTLMHGNHTIAPLPRMPHTPPHPVQNITIFQMLQQLDKFDS